MSIIIQKYGGTSVGSVERIRHVADLIIAERNVGRKVVVVLSAMAGATNHLVNLATQFGNAVGTLAYDFMVSTGENVSCGMLALALGEKRVNAIPLAGWQVPIYTNGLHSKARVTYIQTQYIEKLLTENTVPIITGFQGISQDQQITTLGRGGSDTSAVELAVALKAERCDIYTDIDGIYTADPRAAIEANFIPNISYSAALEMARLGAKIIHPRAVECGMKSFVPLRILSSFGSEKFTTISNKINDPKIIGIAHIRDNLFFEMDPLSTETWLHLLQGLDSLDISADMVANTVTGSSLCTEAADETSINTLLSSLDISFSVHRVAKVSVVGQLFEQDVSNAADKLHAESIPLLYTHRETNRVSFLLQSEQMEKAINILHNLFFYENTKKD